MNDDEKILAYINKTRTDTGWKPLSSLSEFGVDRRCVISDHERKILLDGYEREINSSSQTDKKSLSHIPPHVLANSISERVHTEKASGRKPNIRKTGSSSQTIGENDGDV